MPTFHPVPSLHPQHLSGLQIQQRQNQVDCGQPTHFGDVHNMRRHLQAHLLKHCYLHSHNKDTINNKL